MKKEEVEPQLQQVMDAVPVCEGLLFAKANGEVFVGQTITEMDHKAIAKAIGQMANSKHDSVNKGALVDLTIGLEKGYIVAVLKDEELLIGLLGEDGKTSVGLLLRQLKNIFKLK
jgi:predicted regulator of Ras-like GTPase activity (Roadblock/LC7/MglB family)